VRDVSDNIDILINTTQPLNFLLKCH